MAKRNNFVKNDDSNHYIYYYKYLHSHKKENKFLRLCLILNCDNQKSPFVYVHVNYKTNYVCVNNELIKILTFLNNILLSLFCDFTF